jgi:uncharacterized protein YecT (DUF1311 family)
LEANNCCNAKYLNSETALNFTYEELLSEIPSQSRAALQKAEAAWIQLEKQTGFRHCELLSGSVVPTLRSICLKS